MLRALRVPRVRMPALEVLRALRVRGPRPVPASHSEQLTQRERVPLPVPAVQARRRAPVGQLLQRVPRLQPRRAVQPEPLVRSPRVPPVKPVQPSVPARQAPRAERAGRGLRAVLPERLPRVAPVAQHSLREPPATVALREPPGPRSQPPRALLAPMEVPRPPPARAVRERPQEPAMQAVRATPRVPRVPALRAPLGPPQARERLRAQTQLQELALPVELGQQLEREERARQEPPQEPRAKAEQDARRSLAAPPVQELLLRSVAQGVPRAQGPPPARAPRPVRLRRVRLRVQEVRGVLPSAERRRAFRSARPRQPLDVEAPEPPLRQAPPDARQKEPSGALAPAR